MSHGQVAGRGRTAAGMVFPVIVFSVLLSVSCQASTNIASNVTEIVFTKVAQYADGKLVNSGQPVDYIQIWTPDDGVGEGPLIWHPAKPAFLISFTGTNIQATLLGTKHKLTKIQMRPPIYMETSSGMTVRLNHEPSDDTNAVKCLEATVSLPALGVSDGLYECKETEMGSSIFAHDFPEMELFINSPSNSQPAKLQLAVRGTEVPVTSVHSLAQAKNGAFVFSNQVSSVRFLGNPAYYTTLKVMFTETGGFSNTVVQFKRYGKSLYRNVEPPTRTNDPPARATKELAFYVEVRADSLGNKGKQPVVAITMKNNKDVVEIGRLNLIQVGSGIWQTPKPVVMCASKYRASEITPSDRRSYLFLRAAPSVSRDTAITPILVFPDDHPFQTLKEQKKSHSVR